MHVTWTIECIQPCEYEENYVEAKLDQVSAKSLESRKETKFTGTAYPTMKSVGLSSTTHVLIGGAEE